MGVACISACGEDALIESTAGKRHGGNGNSEFVFEGLPGVVQFGEQLIVSAVREERVAPSVCTDLLSAVEEFLQMRPIHKVFLPASPADGNEKSSREASGLQNRKRIFEV